MRQLAARLEAAKERGEGQSDNRRYLTEVMFLDVREDPQWAHLSDDQVRDVIARHLDEMGIE